MTRYELLDDLKERILQIPIKEIIDSRISEYRYGKYLCPFHDDHTPNNFHIFELTNTYKCFACGEGGNAISFIMAYDNLSYSAAIFRIAVEQGLIVEKDIENTSSEILDLRKKKKIKSEKVEPEIADVDTLDKVYRIFMKGNTLIGKSKLSEEHLMKLKNDRYLSEENIKKTGYFTFPNGFIMKSFLKELMKEGLDTDVLKKVPGFYYNRKSDSYVFSKLKDTTGFGIPILNVDGKVVGIQIRTDDDGRYQWFSSVFVNSVKVKNYTDGTSPGTPVSVFYPETINCRTIFITEGHFKAKKITETFDAISISVQGVNNWKDIPNVIHTLKERYGYLQNIMIAFDADMARKETVLQPAIKMGIALTGLTLDKEMDNDLYKVLHVGNKSKFKNASTYGKEAERISEYLREHVFDFHIYYCLWDEQYGKGIDDLLNAGNDFALKKMDLLTFWNASYHYLKDLDLVRGEISKKEGTEYRKTSVPEDIKLSYFLKDVFAYTDGN